MWSAALVAMFFCACGPRGMGTYRLERIGKELVVIPPPYANIAPRETVSFELPARDRAGPGKRKICSARSVLFRLSATPSGWSATLPSLRAWSRETANGKAHRHFEDILGQIDALAARGCISISHAVQFDQALREALPVAVRDTMLYQYGYSAGDGAINLEAGMRLMIQRAEYNRSGEFQGTETLYYKAMRDSTGRLHIRLAKSAHQGHARILPGDLDLGNRVRGDVYARLFFSGNLVPRNLNYSALVVGTRSLKRMDAAARELQANPQTGCRSQPGNEADCKPYSGMVTVIAELGVTVNGRKVFVAPGDDVQDVLEKTGKTACEKDLQSLRIERRFLGRPLRVVFNPTTDAVLGLDLVANDRVSCSANNGKPGGQQANRGPEGRQNLPRAESRSHGGAAI